MSLKRQFLWSLTPLIAITALNLVSVPLFFRYLGDEMYGLWGYVTALGGMFGFADLGLGVAVGRYVGISLGKQDSNAVREYWGTGNVIAIPLLALMAVAFAAAGMIFGSVWFNAASEHREVLRVCFLAGGAGLFLNYYAQFWTVLLQAHLEFKFTNLLKTLISLVSIGGSLAMAVLTRSPVWILWWGVAVAAVQLLILIPYSKARFQIGFALSAARLERAREMALFTAKVFLSLITNAVSYSMDRMVVGKLAPAPVFALYTVCANAGSRLHAVGGAMIGPIYHNTNRALGGEQAARAGHIYDEMFTFAFRWYLLIALGLTLWHPILLRLWLGAERGERAAPMFVPLILAFCLMALANISTSQLSSLNRVGSLVGFSIAAGLLAVAGTWVGWHFWGIAGVAYGFLASRACYVLQDFYAIRLLKARGWLSGLIWRHAGMQLLVASIFALVYFFLPRDSIWLLIPASLHGIGVTLWLLRKRLVSWFSSKSSNAFQISHW